MHAALKGWGDLIKRLHHRKPIFDFPIDAYLALFSLLGPQAGYDYVRGNALAPARRLMVDPAADGAIGRYVIEAPENLPARNVFLISEPVPAWLVRVDSDMVILPLSGESATSTPLWDWRKLKGDDAVPITAPASWMFQSFGALHAINVHLAGADKIDPLVGLEIRGTLPSGRLLRGTCIMQSGESAALLCADPVS